MTTGPEFQVDDMRDSIESNCVGGLEINKSSNFTDSDKGFGVF